MKKALDGKNNSSGFLYFTPDKPARRRLVCVTNFIRENSCNPWQKAFEL